MELCDKTSVKYTVNHLNYKYIYQGKENRGQKEIKKETLQIFMYKFNNV